MADDGPEPRKIFQPERGDRADLDGREQRPEFGVELGHRSEDHRQHVDDDDRDDQPDEARADRIRQMVVLQQLVEPVPQIGIAMRMLARNGRHRLCPLALLLGNRGASPILAERRGRGLRRLKRTQAPAMAFSIADSAASALAPSGPPACAMSGRPPPPLPPSTSAPFRTRSTALKRLVKSGVTPTTMPALPSSVTPTKATMPEPICFLPSSARPLRSLISIPETVRARSLMLPMLRTLLSPAA